MFDQKIADEICRRLSEGETLRQICETEGFPDNSTVVKWGSGLSGAPQTFVQQYARARSEGLDVIADEAIRIADDLGDDPNSRRVRVDTRKWFLSKLRPEKYGDRLHQVVSDPQGQPLKLEIVHIHGKDEKPEK